MMKSTAERYSLKTVISRDKVSKTACGIYSIDFLFRMLKIGKELNRQYPDKWQCIPCHREKDALVFDTAKGESLRDMLVRLLGERNEEEYFSLIKEYCEFIRNSHGISYFCPSERFREMFGDVKGLEECLSGTLNNIDLTFDNIIVNKDQRTVIDYEWVFDYPIPREYIMYRAVFYFYKELPDNGYYRKMKKETLRIFTIDKKQEKAFMDMEEHFQEAIMGGLKRSYTINWSL